MADPRFAVVGIREPEPAPPRKQPWYDGKPVLSLLVLGLLFPHTRAEDRDTKKEIFSLAKQFRQQFFDTFGHTRCGDLLRSRCGVSEKTAAAARLGLTAHCDTMVVTAVELLSALLEEHMA